MKSVLLACCAVCAAAASAEIRIGVIGCDTSHTLDMTKRINVTKQADFADMRVTLAYQWGSRDIVSSTNRYPKYLLKMREMGVRIVPTLAELLAGVDAVLLETNDGREHYAQAVEVFKAGKPCFIDKPLAHDLTDALRIVKAAKKYNAKFFSTSNNRYQPNPQKARRGEWGEISSAVLYAPYNVEKTHGRYTWYAIHGFEILETIMRRGCESVTVTAGDPDELVACRWKDGRIGVIHCEKAIWDYGGYIIPKKAEGKSYDIGKDDGYEELLVDIAKLFKDGIVPIEPEETLEVAAMMAAAEESRNRGGIPVTIAEVMAKAEAAAD